MKYLLPLVVILLSCNKEKMLRIKGSTMGTTYSISAYSDSVNEEKLSQAVDELLKTYNLRFSTYIENSELSRVNQAPLNIRLAVSDELFKVIETAYTVYQKSGGAYDITVGPIVNRWGFGPLKAEGAPSDAEISQLLERTGFDKLTFKKGALVKKKDIYLDLSSIAKGDAVDKLAGLLEKKFNIRSYFVEIGGEVKVKGQKPNGEHWKVGIEKPSVLQGEGIVQIISPKDGAIATSGSYRNYKKYGDQVFSHLIDPRSGRPVNHKTISVSVFRPSCAVADAWATAFMSLGAEKGIKIANSEGIAAFFLVEEQGEVKTLSSNTWSDI